MASGKNPEDFLQVSIIFESLKVKIDGQNPLKSTNFTGSFKGGNRSILTITLCSPRVHICTQIVNPCRLFLCETF